MIWFLIFIFTLYAILIVSLSIGFSKVDEFVDETIIASTKFSIIIPFRNEAENLPLLLKSIAEIKYPKELMEFIFVDDDSSDNSIEIINNFHNQIKVITNKRVSNSPKKDAITTAISVAKNDWIITSDADCILPKNWLNSFDSFIQKHKPKMVVAPVNYQVKNTFLERYQLLDFMSMQGTTIGGFGINFPFLCNAANLGYKKEEFLKLSGFEGNNNMASGDDIFLFEKFIKKNKNSVKYLKSKEAIVTTFPEKTWRDLINQRTRWAAKTGNISSIKVKLIGLLITLINLSIILSFTLAIFQQIELVYFILLFLIKLFVDLLIFIKTLRFFNHDKALTTYFFSSLLYPFFSLTVVLKSVFFKYNWKGRSFKK